VAEDEASLYLQATLQAVWHWRGETPIVKLHPGRECVHFYGSLNLLTGEEIVTRTTVMKAETTALHIQQVLAANPDKPVLMLIDKAPWHFGPAIDALLTANPRLELMYFPTAAPDLNPQEHVWKAVRNNVSHNHLTAKLRQLATDFETYLTSTRFASPLLANHDYQHICAMFK
jgi:transposase